ncbi:MAG TPA: hypothetical protein EYN67_15860 [Flavobacteriales bacterium]|nr:hypothetical protein [Flavobacteriales bacterium]
MATSRNRIIYQSEALFIAPNSTGFHIQTGAATGPTVAQISQDDTYSLIWSGVTGRSNALSVPSVSIPVKNRSLLEPMERIQSANFNFTINRQDINEFGQLARLDSIVMESPTVGLDFNYYLTDGGNERKMGFNVPTSAQDLRYKGAGNDRSSTAFWTGDGCISGFSALSGILNDPQGNNFFITVVPDGKDVQGTTALATTGTDYTKNDVVAIGNGFISDYTVEAAVGSVPTASVTVEAFNIKVDDHLSGAPLDGSNNFLDEGVPGVTLEGNSGLCRYVFQTGVGNTGTAVYQQTNGKSFNTTGSSTVAALRPGDLTLTMENSGSYIGLADMAGVGAAHIQSFTINVPLSRTVLQRLGSTFGYARVVDFPVDISCTVSAVVSDLQSKNLFTELCSRTTHNFTLNMRDSSCTTAGSTKMKFIVKNARLDSETFTNAIGDNESVDMTFTAQIGGANDTSNGLFIEGSYPRFRTLPYWPLGAMKDNETTYKGTPLWLG